VFITLDPGIISDGGVFKLDLPLTNMLLLLLCGTGDVFRAI
jgi:hypothetical protein